MKLAAYELNAMPQPGRDFFACSSVHRTKYGFALATSRSQRSEAEAWADVLKRAKLVAHHKISREELSVREHMSAILRRLQDHKFVEFSELFDQSRGAPVVVVNFVALLELAKESLIEITQAESFAPIYVRLAYAPV